MITVSIGRDESDSRLDRVVRRSLPLTPLSVVYKLIRTGVVRLNGSKAHASSRLREHDLIEIMVDKEESPETAGDRREALCRLFHTGFFRKNFHLLFEDDYLLACLKPAGLVVHAGTGHGGNDSLIALAESYLLNSAPGEDDTPYLMHRLDKDTSGVVVIAKQRRTVRLLGEQLRRRNLTKWYCAFCHGAVQPKRGRILLPVERTSGRRSGMKMIVSGTGKEAESFYTVRRVYDDVTEVRIQLLTGRTHQIRVHFASIGFPLVGDARYGDREKDRVLFKRFRLKPRLFLHASTLSLHHPFHHTPLTIRAPEPTVFRALRCGEHSGG